MKLLQQITLIFLVSVLPLTIQAQCRDFAEQVIKTTMSPYIHDGNYNGVLLNEGQTIEIKKDFQSGQQYRMIICGSANLPNIEFDVMDDDRNVLFSNRSSGFSKYWDFKPEASRNLIISIKVPMNKNSKHLNGCVVALFGVKNN